MAKAAEKPKGRVITVDFTGVETGARGVRIPEGDYGFRITKVKGGKGEESGKPYLDFSFEVIKGDKRGLKKELHHFCSLQPKALFNFKNLLEACGKEVPSKALKIDVDKLMKLECAGTVIDDEYEGRKKSVISAFFPMADLGKTSSTGDDLEEAGEEEQEEESTEEEEKEESEEEDLFN